MKETILITGADKGLGRAFARYFLEQGFRVFAGVYQSPLAQADSFDPALTLLPLDISDASSVQHALEIVAKETEHLDILINNAGIHLETHRPPLLETDFDVVEQTFRVNAMGPLRVTKAFYPFMMRGKRKLIANISSEAGSITNCWRKNEYGYSMSKAALNMQSRILANDLEPQGFTVLAFHPGWMQTDMGGVDAEVPSTDSAAAIARLMLRDQPAKHGMYLDYQGNPLPW